MELRVLHYFLAVTRERSISKAAEFLHLSQPTLSRQLKEMEEELGKQLFIRGNRSITLTEEGMLLRKRAEEILDLVHKTEHEISLSNELIAGDICIGAGETDGLRLLLRAAKQLQASYPLVHFHMISGDAMSVTEQLDKGLIDFGLLLESADTARYHSIKLPMQDSWGVFMRRDSPLAVLDAIHPEDLWDKPLIVSRQTMEHNFLQTWFPCDINKLNIAATYNLVFNASLMVEEGMGYALSLDKLIHTNENSCLCFRPLDPPLTISMFFVWKKYSIFTKAASKYLEILKALHLD